MLVSGLTELHMGQVFTNGVMEVFMRESGLKARNMAEELLSGRPDQNIGEIGFQGRCRLSFLFLVLVSC